MCTIHPVGIADGPKSYNSLLEGGPDFSAHAVSQVLYQQQQPPEGWDPNLFSDWDEPDGFI